MNIKPLVIRGALGSLPGLALSAAGVIQLNRSLKDSKKILKTDLVDSKKIIAQHAPNIVAVTGEEDLAGLNASGIKKIKRIIDYTKRTGNAANLGGIIVASPIANRSMLGHEIGHSLDPKANKKSLFLSAGIIGGREQGAWDASPFQDAESKRVSKKMVGTYRGGDKMILGGILAGTGLSASIAPLLMKALKK